MEEEGEEDIDLETLVSFIPDSAFPLIREKED